MQGTWQGSTTTETYGQEQTTFVLTQNGSDILGTLQCTDANGTCVETEDVTGSINNSMVSISAIFRGESDVEYLYTGTSTGNTYSGNVDLNVKGGVYEEGGTFSVAKSSGQPSFGTYLGIATLTVWYKENALLNLPPQQRTYQQDVIVDIGPPLEGEDGTTEENPFYFISTNPPMAPHTPGNVSAHSATLYSTDLGYYTVFQYWEYISQGESVQGTLKPHALGSDNFNYVVAEDLSGILSCCTLYIERGATIDIRFYDGRLTMNIAGTVYDPFSEQLCITLVDRFELTIEATEQ